ATPAPAPALRPGFLSDTRGHFQVGAIPAGRVVVTASHPDFVRAASQPIAVRAGTDVKVRLVLSRGASVRGRVVDDRGPPLRRAEVRSSDGRYAAASSARGDYQLLHVSGALKLTARLSGYLPQTKEAPPTGGLVDFELAPARERLSGVVVDDRG